MCFVHRFFASFLYCSLSLLIALRGNNEKKEQQQSHPFPSPLIVIWYIPFVRVFIVCMYNRHGRFLPFKKKLIRLVAQSCIKKGSRNIYVYIFLDPFYAILCDQKLWKSYLSYWSCLIYNYVCIWVCVCAWKVCIRCGIVDENNIGAPKMQNN